jgi:hypothetical protein
VIGAPQPQSKFNVLDAGTGVIVGIETEALKNIASYGTTSCPECCRFRVRVLMDVMVDEVLILREETWLCRRSIVRPKNCSEVTVLFEVVGNDLQSEGRNCYIGIHKD